MRKTKAEREAEKKLEAKRAKERERWHQRKLDKEYMKAKLEKKAEWQKKNAKKNLEYVQAFYERYGISGRAARAAGKDGARSVAKEERCRKPPTRSSRKRDTASAKVTRGNESGFESLKRGDASETRRHPRGSQLDPCSPPPSKQSRSCQARKQRSRRAKK